MAGGRMLRGEQWVDFGPPWAPQGPNAPPWVPGTECSKSKDLCMSYGIGAKYVQNKAAVAIYSNAQWKFSDNDLYGCIPRQFSCCFHYFIQVDHHQGAQSVMQTVTIELAGRNALKVTLGYTRAPSLMYPIRILTCLYMPVWVGNELFLLFLHPSTDSRTSVVIVEDPRSWRWVLCNPIYLCLEFAILKTIYDKEGDGDLIIVPLQMTALNANCVFVTYKYTHRHGHCTALQEQHCKSTSEKLPR